MTRTAMIKAAAALPKGDPRRRKLLASLKRGESMGASMSRYMGYARKFKTLTGLRLVDASHTGGTFRAEYAMAGDGFTVDGPALMAFLRLSKVSRMTCDRRGVSLFWSEVTDEEEPTDAHRFAATKEGASLMDLSTMPKDKQRQVAQMSRVLGDVGDVFYGIHGWIVMFTPKHGPDARFDSSKLADVLKGTRWFQTFRDGDVSVGM